MAQIGMKGFQEFLTNPQRGDIWTCENWSSSATSVLAGNTAPALANAAGLSGWARNARNLSAKLLVLGARRDADVVDRNLFKPIVLRNHRDEQEEADFAVDVGGK
jgi:hypothetical protein